MKIIDGVLRNVEGAWLVAVPAETFDALPEGRKYTATYLTEEPSKLLVPGVPDSFEIRLRNDEGETASWPHGERRLRLIDNAGEDGQHRAMEVHEGRKEVG